MIDPSLPVLLGIVAAGVLAGASIGAVGVGGVLLTPLLLTFTSFPVVTLVAAASFSFLFTGVVGALAYARRGSVPWRAAGWLGAGVAPSALAGAVVSGRLAPAWPLGALALLLVVAAAQALRPAPPRTVDATEPVGPAGRLSAATLLALGLVAGFGSALTGTGGPVMLVPLLSLAGVAPLAAVGAAQVVQLPLAVAASVGHAASGNLDPGLGLLLGLSQAGAVVVGARVAHALPTARLRRVLGVALVAAALVAIVPRLIAAG